MTTVYREKLFASEEGRKLQGAKSTLYTVLIVYMTGQLSHNFELVIFFFQGILMFLQNLPTHHWQNEEIGELLAEAFKLKYMFADAPNHLSKKK